MVRFFAGIMGVTVRLLVSNIFLAATFSLNCPAALAANPALASASPPAASAPASESYPHIGALETAILGQSHPGDKLAARLARMELKAFGKASTDPDLSNRTDKLEDYSQKTLHQKAYDAGSAYDVEEGGHAPPPEEAPQARSVGAAGGAGSYATDNGGADMSGSVSASQTKYPHITALEQEILAQTYENESLNDRLTRMEMKAYGSKSSSVDYSERTDALENYATRKLKKKPFVQEQRKEAEAADGGSGGGGGGGGTQNKLLNFVGNSLLSMAGVGRLGGPVMGGNPGLNSGMGGGLIPGFGGVRMRPRSSQPQDGQPTQQQVDMHPEDPSVHDATPPTAEAKMLTKVGWCEVQVFGHTSPNMHLKERLEQLNKELNYAPGMTGLELMDKVAGLMKAAQARHNGTAGLTSIDSQAPGAKAPAGTTGTPATSAANPAANPSGNPAANPSGNPAANPAASAGARPAAPRRQIGL